MTDMTIKAIRTTLLRVPWPDTPWLKGHAFGDARNILVLDVETAGGIVGMGYLFVFRPGLRTVIACLEEAIVPRVLAKDLRVRIDLAQLDALPGVRWMAKGGGIAEAGMLRTFNCGVGMIVVADPAKAEAVEAVFRREGETVSRLGEIVAAEGESRVVYNGALDLSLGPAGAS